MFGDFSVFNPILFIVLYWLIRFMGYIHFLCFNSICACLIYRPWRYRSSIEYSAAILINWPVWRSLSVLHTNSICFKEMNQLRIKFSFIIYPKQIRIVFLLWNVVKCYLFLITIIIMTVSLLLRFVYILHLIRKCASPFLKNVPRILVHTCFDHRKQNK